MYYLKGVGGGGFLYNQIMRTEVIGRYGLIVGEEYPTSDA